LELVFVDARFLAANCGVAGEESWAALRAEMVLGL
jgi:hypothetical protein